jgi:hypothetical protein
VDTHGKKSATTQRGGQLEATGAGDRKNASFLTGFVEPKLE